MAPQMMMAPMMMGVPAAPPPPPTQPGAAPPPAPPAPGGAQPAASGPLPGLPPLQMPQMETLVFSLDGKAGLPSKSAGGAAAVSKSGMQPPFSKDNGIAVKSKSAGPPMGGPAQSKSGMEGAMSKASASKAGMETASSKS